MPKLKEQLLADQAVSYWLKEQLAQLVERDPVEALHDAELLLQAAQEHLQESIESTAAEALASVRMEGGEVSAMQFDLDQRLIHGEIDHDQAIAETLFRYKKT